MSDLSFVIVGQQAWDTDIGSNCKDIALEISKRHRVIYINSPLDRATRWLNGDDPRVKRRWNVIKGREDGLVEIKENLWNYYPNVLAESINWIPSQAVFDLFNKRNNRLLATSINTALTRLSVKNFILFN